MKMRVMAALVLIPVLLVVLFVAPPIFVSIVTGLICAIGVYELLVGTGFVKNIRLIAYTAVAAFCVPIWCCAGSVHLWGSLGVFLYVGLLFSELLISKGKQRFERLAVCIAGGLIIPYLLSALIRILGDGTNRMMILVPFVLAYMSDTGAFFIGCAWGRHKLAPTISPKKSVEGLVGGILFAVLGMLLYCLILNLGFKVQVNYLYAVTYGILGSFAGTFGDLCFSAIKRQAGIKDYGNLIPGHGGILDRVDSLIIVAPLVEILLAMLPILE